ncbi:hypothetical protein C8E87_0309 [Paractinoplanes brasiliensis]|uniref:Uncharacterized protein n=1 Tax=Paractinoplanes brasiliensis TaxID=52695 RepID=A0A4R6JLN9_9ACTN|nr:hypothetical protein C8E87_0309 [Actinoplanes brasiliensis]GID32365.1 hypothetical protein Abr02nite_73480 [Actinoplanes brasiliensis]
MNSHPHDASATTGRGPVLAGILSAASADDVLRTAFDRAELGDVPLIVLLAGGGEPPGSVAYWAGQHPRVVTSVSVPHGVDPAIALTAATGRAGLAVLPAAADAQEAAVVRAVTRRARCPVLTATAGGAGERAPGNQPPAPDMSDHCRSSVPVPAPSAGRRLRRRSRRRRRSAQRVRSR